jgi:hypothetical protein
MQPHPRWRPWPAPAACRQPAGGGGGGRGQRGRRRPGAGLVATRRQRSRIGCVGGALAAGGVLRADGALLQAADGRRPRRLPRAGGWAGCGGRETRALCAGRERGLDVRWQRGADRARSHCRFAPLLIHFSPDLLIGSVSFLKRQCDRAPGAEGEPRGGFRPHRAGGGSRPGVATHVRLRTNMFTMMVTGFPPWRTHASLA